jgi:hypothetical protein
MNIEVEVKMQIQLKKTKINCTCTKTLYPTLTNMLPLSCVFDSISENNKSVIDYVFIDLVGRKYMWQSSKENITFISQHVLYNLLLHSVNDYKH